MHAQVLLLLYGCQGIAICPVVTSIKYSRHLLLPSTALQIKYTCFTLDLLLAQFHGNLTA